MVFKLTPISTFFLTLAPILSFASSESTPVTKSTEGASKQVGDYSQQELLKNWALAACLGETLKSKEDRDDVSASASAYMEFGEQPIEAYEALRKIAHKYASLKYGGSIKSEFNLMKCIDLFHSTDLEKITKKLATPKT